MKNVVIIGGTGGIGEAVVKKFVNKGCNVIFSYYNSENRAIRLVEDICQSEYILKPFYLNASESSSVEKFSEEVGKVFDRIDAIIYCSGIVKDNSFFTMTPNTFKEVIAVNLFGCYLILKELFSSLNFKKGASIVAVSSTGGIRPNPGQANYAASKAGIVAMIESIAREYAKKNIRANAVAPGFINTEMVDLGNTKIQKSIEEIPMGRLGETLEVANAVYFLASEEASYITAQTLIVDGGRL